MSEWSKSSFRRPHTSRSPRSSVATCYPPRRTRASTHSDGRGEESWGFNFVDKPDGPNGWLFLYGNPLYRSWLTSISRWSTLPFHFLSLLHQDDFLFRSRGTSEYKRPNLSVWFEIKPQLMYKNEDFFSASLLLLCNRVISKRRNVWTGWIFWVS